MCCRNQDAVFSFLSDDCCQYFSSWKIDLFFQLHSRLVLDQIVTLTVISVVAVNLEYPRILYTKRLLGYAGKLLARSFNFDRIDRNNRVTTRHLKLKVNMYLAVPVDSQATIALQEGNESPQNPKHTSNALFR
jgi:hypothetical protein